MCFSAPASFVAGGVLAAGGVATLHETKDVRQIPLASFPLLFGIQQIIEGFVWLSFSASWHALVVHMYAMFSHVLWPLLTPLAILSIETDTARIKMLRMCVVVGSLTAFYQAYAIIVEPVTANIIDHSISYNSMHLYPETAMLMYLVATCGSCFLSSHRLVNLFGTMLFLSFIASYILFNATFFSVWCFFAAVLSVVIYFHIRSMSVTQ